MRLKRQSVKGGEAAIVDTFSNNTRHRFEQKRNRGRSESAACPRRRNDAVEATMTVLIKVV